MNRERIFGLEMVIRLDKYIRAIGAQLSLQNIRELHAEMRALQIEFRIEKTFSGFRFPLRKANSCL